ncbi:MAG: hypothetical protein R2716_07710 [Microthrixaceae bacterium]
MVEGIATSVLPGVIVLDQLRLDREPRLGIEHRRGLLEHAHRHSSCGGRLALEPTRRSTGSKPRGAKNWHVNDAGSEIAVDLARSCPQASDAA